MNEAKMNSHYGPDGRNCTCCGPCPRFRKKHDRMVKRRVKQIIRKEIKLFIRDISDN